MRKRRFAINPNEELPQVNLTPLIDVVFVVLIAFILIAPLLELEQISLAESNRSKELSHVNDPTATITIRVYKNNEIRINEQKVTTEALLSHLRNLKKKHPQVIPRLFHDKRAYFGTYQQIKNSIELAGFEKLDVILQPN